MDEIFAIDAQAHKQCLGSVLPGLANFPFNRIGEFTPTAWLVRN